MTVTREALDVDVSYYDHRAPRLCHLTSCSHFLEIFLEPSEVAFWHVPRILGLFNITWAGHGLSGRAITPVIRLGLSFRMYL